MALYETLFDGGQVITHYELFVNDGGSSTSYRKITTYDGQSSTHTVTVADDLLSAGTIYKFKYRAVNSYGSSDYSEELNAGLGALPLKPNPVRWIESESGETHITLEWDASANTQLPVLGYSLKINDGVGGHTYTDTMVGGSVFPNVHKFVVGQLQTGFEYGFTLEALNFNGASEPSDPAYFTICTVPK